MAPWKTDFFICDNFHDNFFYSRIFYWRAFEIFSERSLWFSVREWLFDGGVVTTPHSLVYDDVAIQCNRPMKSRYQVKYETIYHTFSSCRRPSQPIGWFQIRHTHFDYFPFTWCADFTFYFTFLTEKTGHIKRNRGYFKDNVRWYVRIFLWRK